MANATTPVIQINEGNVGIGMGSPVKALDINGEARVNSILTLNRGSAASLKFSRGSDFYLGVDNSGNLNFLNNAASSLGVWENTGNVGVGTTSPGSRKIMISTSGSANDIGLEVNMSRASGGNYAIRGLAYGIADTNVGGFFNATGATTSNTSIWGYNGKVILCTQNATDYVGIGTASPGEKLHVLGKVLLNNGSSLYIDTSATQTVFANIVDIPIRFQTNSANRLTIGGTGAIQFNDYGAGTLVTDASGNITASSGGGEGGPYLPLSAGSSYPLIDSLYLAINKYIYSGTQAILGGVASGTEIYGINNKISL